MIVGVVAGGGGEEILRDDKADHGCSSNTNPHLWVCTYGFAPMGLHLWVCTYGFAPMDTKDPKKAPNQLSKALLRGVALKAQREHTPRAEH
eukprot:SAG11_NODE_4451_length_1889_cov_9.508939_1_plen_91_part_00